ncbi:MAG TPA: phosphatidate cytidylyltransferase [Gemmatimonadales bacterium]|nr:phosphatidate cytidylyltransferase [Gemmatimonadales bacterium]
MDSIAQASEGNLVRRVGFAAVAIPLALAVVWYGGLPLAFLLALVAALGTNELFGLAARQGIRPARTFALVSAAALAPVTYATLVAADVRALIEPSWPFLLAGWVIGLLTWTLAARAPGEKPLESASVTLLGVAYTSVLPAFLLVIRHGTFAERSWPAAWLVFFPLVVTWVCDTAAMFGGRLMAGPKLAPAISPGKTRSGAAAGVIGGLLVAPLFGAVVFPRVGVEAHLWQLVVMAGVLSIIGQIGDLVESLLKRAAGVKDASQLIPGHGGVLDRFDSLYFVIPVAAAMYRLFGII